MNFIRNKSLRLAIKENNDRSYIIDAIIELENIFKRIILISKFEMIQHIIFNKHLKGHFSKKMDKQFLHPFKL